MPPRFGVSAAEAGAISPSAASAARALAKRDATIVSSCSSSLSLPPAPSLVEPDRGQVLVDEVRRGDLEPLDVGAVGHDAVPPQRIDLVRLLIEHVILEFAHQGALLLRVGLVQHRVVELDLARILVVAVILTVDRA